MGELLVREITNKYGSLLHMGTKKRLSISQHHIENLTHERPIVDILENDFYDIFLDIGAGFGYFTRIAANYGRHVYAFEPHPLRCGFLKWNTRDLPNVGVSNVPVGTGKVDLYVSPHPGGMMGSKHVHRNTKSFIVPVEIDHEYLYDFESILIKIDVEGNEIDVIRSGKNIKKGNNATWIVELHRSIVDKEDLFKEFEGYEREKILERKNTEHWKFWKA